MLVAAFKFLNEGFTHVLPLGLDHILFISSLFFLNSNLKSVVLQCTFFTLAHSITLFLSAYQILLPNIQIVEPLIALSIVYTSLENIFRNEVNKWRLLIIFCFGLIHGMGFAIVLQDISLEKYNFITSLISFNIGVEIAQLFILMMLYYGIAFWFKNKFWYNQRVVYPISSLIACVAIFWFIQRIL